MRALQTILDKEFKGIYYPLTDMSKEMLGQLINDHFLFKEGDRHLQAANACRFWSTGHGIFHNDNKVCGLSLFSVDPTLCRRSSYG